MQKVTAQHAIFKFHSREFSLQMKVMKDAKGSADLFEMKFLFGFN